MSLPSVTVVIPVYGRPAELAAAINSLISEADLIHEVVIVDDASPEPVIVTPPLELSGKLRLLRLETNRGASGARQAGVDAATGDIIAFLDSDDIWLPGKLAAQLPLLRAEGMTAVACGWQVYNVSGKKGYTRLPIASEDPIDFASGCWFCPGATTLVPRSAFLRIGPFDATLKRLEDLDWFLRFSLAGGRLAVAPVIGAIVAREARANIAAVDGSVSRLNLKFASDPRMSRIARKKLAAWLLIERAFARKAAGKYLSMFWLCLNSCRLSPRFSYTLKSWWTVGPTVVGDQEARRRLGRSAP
jgi:glycosyltransferase involved in cell wall biosynthesis